MAGKSYSNELRRTLSRADAQELTRQIQVYHDHFLAGLPEWTDENSDDLHAIMSASFDDPDKAFAYVMLAAANYDNGDFLGFVAAGPLENLLVDPSPEILERAVAEARKTPRFRWLLSIPFPHALAPKAWSAIKEFVVNPDTTPLPQRPWA